VASSRSLRDTAESPVENPWDTPDTSEDHDVPSDSNGDFEIHDASTTVAKPEPARSVISTPSDESPSSANFSRPRLVTIPKRTPPALPPRNPVRRRGSQSTQGSVVAGPTSPSTSTHGEASTAIDSTSDGEKTDVEKAAQEDSQESHLDAPAAPEPETHEETPAVEKDEFHSTSTSPTEESKILELKDETKEEAKEEAKEESKPDAEKAS
jgi:hypothetical protein